MYTTALCIAVLAAAAAALRQIATQEEIRIKTKNKKTEKKNAREIRQIDDLSHRRIVYTYSACLNVLSLRRSPRTHTHTHAPYSSPPPPPPPLI